MDQFLQIVAALLILAAFAATQFQMLDPRSYRSLGLNLVGSAILAWLAYHGQQWGFLLLNTVWSLVSLWGLISRLRAGAGTPISRSDAPPGPTHAK